MTTTESGGNNFESKEGFIPEVRFEMAEMDREADLFDNFIKKDNWPDNFKKHAELVSVLEGVTDEEERKRICLEYVEKLRGMHAEEMEAFVAELKEGWNTVSEDFLKTLSEHFETEWSGDTEITGHVSGLPVFPRFLKDHLFYIGYKDLPKMIEISAHEILHFLWFKKWKEVFPEMSAREYERPNLVWKLSEIMDPIILQCNPDIQVLIKPKSWGYPSFRDKTVAGVGMTEYFKKIYLDSVAAGDSFDVTLRKLWAEARLHESELVDF